MTTKRDFYHPTTPGWGGEGHNAWDGVVLNGYLEAADTRSQMKETGIIYYHYCYHGGLYQQGWPLADSREEMTRV